MLTLHIRPDGEHQVVARIFDGKRLVGDPTVHPQLEQAIKAYGDAHFHAPDVAASSAYDLWFCGWTVGAVTVDQMRDDAHALAQRLVMLAAVMR